MVGREFKVCVLYALCNIYNKVNHHRGSHQHIGECVKQPSVVILCCKVKQLNSNYSIMSDRKKVIIKKRSAASVCVICFKRYICICSYIPITGA